MKLADPRRAGDMSLEEAVFSRRTVRSFAPRPLSFDQFSQLLWAGQGSTDAGGFRRSSPSAGALYPIDLFAVVGRDTVEKVGAGLYLYESSSHTATLLLEGDHRDELAGAALSQFWMARSPLLLVVAAEFDRITGKYGTRGERYAVMEAGHIAQNIMLQAVALGLVSGIVGAFVDVEIQRILHLDRRVTPLVILPVGHPGR